MHLAGCRADSLLVCGEVQVLQVCEVEVACQQFLQVFVEEQPMQQASVGEPLQVHPVSEVEQPQVPLVSVVGPLHQAMRESLASHCPQLWVYMGSLPLVLPERQASWAWLVHQLHKSLGCLVSGNLLAHWVCLLQVVPPQEKQVSWAFLGRLVR